MSDDDLVKRLRTPMVGVTLQACFKERYEAADRIEELEAAVEGVKYFLKMHPFYSNADCRVLIKKALAELNYAERSEKKGENRG